jgi:hypothetical protein
MYRLHGLNEPRYVLLINLFFERLVDNLQKVHCAATIKPKNMYSGVRLLTEKPPEGKN